MNSSVFCREQSRPPNDAILFTLITKCRPALLVQVGDLVALIRWKMVSLTTRTVPANTTKKKMQNMNLAQVDWFPHGSFSNFSWCTLHTTVVYNSHIAHPFYAYVISYKTVSATFSPPLRISLPRTGSCRRDQEDSARSLPIAQLPMFPIKLIFLSSFFFSDFRTSIQTGKSYLFQLSLSMRYW